jgi:uncharacterized protein (TIGR02444 family)
VSEQPSRFWAFSLAVYGDAGVQAECLALQDRHGIDVNLLLFCAYVGAVGGAVLPVPALREAEDLVKAWHRDIVRNLRESRRRLKPFAAAASAIADAAAELRGAVKAAELAAERLEQLMLEEWSGARLGAWPRAEPSVAVAANIGALLAVADGAPQPSRLIAAAIAVAPGPA